MKNTACLLLLAACASFVMATDPCSFIAQEPIEIDQALKCFKSVPFSEEIRDKTIDSLLKTIPFYAFVDAALDSPWEVNLNDSLSEIAANTYDTDVDFHAAVFSLFNSLDDAHTQYRVPACYSLPTIAIGVPFLGMYSAVVDGGQKIFLGKPMSNMNEFYTKNYGINLESYADKELLQINGEDAVTYMVKFADNFVGISKDISVRFNIALMTGFWGYGLRNLQTLSEPTTYTIEGESNSITIPLFALPLINVSSSEHFSSICFGPSPSRTQVHEAKNYLKTFIPAPEVPPVNNSTTIETILEGDNINFYIMNGTTAVIEIPSFEPNDTSVFLKQMKQGFHTCVSRFVKNYIIDLTGNGGGDIELGYEFIQYLFPLFNPLNLYDMKQNPLGDQLATNAATSRNSSDWSYQAYMSNQYKPFSDETWYTHGNTWTRGGVTGNYSQQFYFNFGPLEAQEHKKTQKFTRLTPVNSILILSKGFCGSTCAVTSRHLHEFDGVYTVSACGLQNTQLSFSSFPGGQVYALDDLVADLETYHLESSPLAPQSLPTSATFSFAIKEIYGPDLTIPAEFVVDFADFRLDCTPTSANYQRELWIDAVQFFDEIET